MSPWRAGEFATQTGGRGLARSNFYRHKDACKKKQEVKTDEER